MMTSSFPDNMLRPYGLALLWLLTVTLVGGMAGTGQAQTEHKTHFMDPKDVDRIMNDPGPSRVKDNTPVQVQGSALNPVDLSRNIARLKGVLILDAAEGSDKLRARLFTKLRVFEETKVEAELPDGTIVLESIASIQQLICFLPAYRSAQAFQQVDQLGLIGKISDMQVPVEMAEKDNVATANVAIEALKALELKYTTNIPVFTAVRKAIDITVMRFNSGQRFYREKWLSAAEYAAERNKESVMKAN